MNHAWDLASIQGQLSKAAKRKWQAQFDRASGCSIVECDRLGQILHDKQSIPTLLGILFARPDLDVFEKHVAPHLNFLHHASGTTIDFFCVGYGAYWPPGNPPFDPPYQDARAVSEIERPGWPSEKWLYSDKAFVNVVNEIEAISTWKYRDGASLLLLSASCVPDESAALDFSQTLSIPLSRAMADGALNSVSELLNDIIAMAKDRNSSAWSMSDRFGTSVFLASVAEHIAGKLPIGLGKAAKRSAHFAINDFSKKQ